MEKKVMKKRASRVNFGVTVVNCEIDFLNNQKASEEKERSLIINLSMLDSNISIELSESKNKFWP